MKPFVTPPGATEIVEKRNEKSKTFELADGRRVIKTGMSARHVPDDFTKYKNREKVGWLDADTKIQKTGKFYRPTNCWYDCRLSDDAIEYTYDAKRQGQVSVRLAKINGVPVESLPINISPRLDIHPSHGENVYYEDVLPGLDMFVVFKPARVSIFKLLKDSRVALPFSLEWEMERQDNDVTKIKTETVAWDNNDEQDPDRLDGFPINRRRLCEVVNEVSSETPVGQKVIFTAKETLTGRTVFRNINTRQREMVNEILYPIMIDQDITEDIVSDGDDGYEVSGGWTATTINDDWCYTFGGNPYYPGLRFQTIPNINSGDTIDANTLLRLFRRQGSGNLRMVVYGDDVDDAPVWSGTSRPSQVTKTAASTTYIGDPAGSFTVDVQSIVQEIVNRGGWTANNDMRFACLGTTYTNSASLEDYYYPTGNEAVLEIYYTAGGAANPKGPLGMPLHRPLRGPLGV